MTIMLSIELSSERPIFGDNYSFMLWPDRDKTLFDHSLDEWISCSLSQSSSYNPDLYKRTILCKLYYIDEPILEGNEYSIVLSRNNPYPGPDNLENWSSQGRVEIKFAVSKLALMNSITINPDVLLDNGNIINEISINPFHIFVSANGQTTFHHDVHKYISLVDTDGNEIKLSPLNYYYDKDGRWLKFKNENGIITLIPFLEEFPVAYTGPIYDEDGNKITLIYDGTKGGQLDSAITLKIDIYPYNTIDVSNLSAIIINGEKIPLR